MNFQIKPLRNRMNKTETDIFISKDKYTPEVIFDIKNNFFSLKGVSYPEDASKFYEPLIKKTQNYVNNNLGENNSIKIEIDLDYFNTSTASALYKILYIFNNEKNIDVNLVWAYEKDDDDLYEAGKNYEYIFKNIKFKLKEK